MEQKSSLQLVVKPHIDEDVLRPIEQKLGEMKELLGRLASLMYDINAMSCDLKVSLDVYPRDTSVENPQ